MKHTPGPWKVLPPENAVLYNHNNQEFGWMIYGDAPSDWYADCITMGKFSEADAHLVATAPELLEVLKQVEWTNAVDGGTVCPWCGNRKYDGHDQDCPRQAVIAKAGEVT